MEVGIALNIILSLWIIPTYLGKKRKIGFTWSLVACVFLTPILGVIITLLSPKLPEYKKESIRKRKELKSINNRFKEELLNYENKLDDLKDLKDKGILTQDEFNQKSAKLKADKTKKEVEQTAEYKKLKDLYDDGILTKEEFESKTKNLFQKFKNINNIKVNLYGQWLSEDMVYLFNMDNSFKFYPKNTKESIYKSGHWKIIDKNTIIVNYNKRSVLKIKEITENKLVYLYENKKHILQKIN
ncbi:SHOCT domain-containing protein [Psychroflexus maritimus]|uniref:SHOCT domain-containing protein n=1 Tax=Psychroflexus maritimus TaxID=2714865 RepID=A0A967ALA9_9FLAO|nr:SHOCT domain-containing protein [Psychroflexus maritimus]NGZ90404.1 SHOCT domain-containing protein [Psychroflexus maritimus]